MKKLLLLTLSLSAISIYAQEHTGRVGINTEQPNATLEIAGKPSDATVVDGVIVPKITGNELFEKSAIYTTAQKGALVYVTTAPSTDKQIGKTQYVFEEGYHYFNGEKWEPLNPQFVKVDSGFGTRYRRDFPNKYGNNVGENAIDFSFGSDNGNYGAKGAYSFAVGRENLTKSDDTFISGRGNIINESSPYSTIFGNGNTANAQYSFITGNSNTIIQGNRSTIFGRNNLVDNRYGTNVVGGNDNKLYGGVSFAFGNGLDTKSPLSFNIGYNNEIETHYNPDGTDPKNRVFVIGNGTRANRSNALTVWAVGFHKWQMLNLNSHTSAAVNEWNFRMEKGMHSADIDGVLNTYDGEQWKKYVAVSFSSSAPANAKQGDMYFDTTQKKYFAYDGEEWKAMW